MFFIPPPILNLSQESRHETKLTPFTPKYKARAYAKALNATLFFSSASYNINVNKIFKFVTAKLFDIPWTLKRNLTVGEPIIDF
ncbi:hypothetical protein HanOQP8_Chr16g0604421 [Helianthus annuus]|nr:hypothetical protein HanLR1_Chr16g0608331 [Helianthus annuus]KAJ0643788.1 hypothetical protein HanOQP8_Chr16g0604421 [Helianthus annuus]